MMGAAWASLSHGAAPRRRACSPCAPRTRMRRSTSCFCSALTRSTLFSSTLSAKATCCTLSLMTSSGFSSSRCSRMCLASTCESSGAPLGGRARAQRGGHAARAPPPHARTTVRMESRRSEAFRSSSTKNVCGQRGQQVMRAEAPTARLAPAAAARVHTCATGAGSARPVVSIMIASNRFLRLSSLLRMRMRSPRTAPPACGCVSATQSARPPPAQPHLLPLPACAAHAAVVHLKDLLLGVHHQRVVYAHLAKLILDHRHLFAMVACAFAHGVA